MSPRRRFAVVLSGPAKHDLVEIASSYAERHPAGERRFFDPFATARGLLSQHPRIGRERPELRIDLRSWPVYPYTLFYTVGTAERRVAVVRVIHGHMDVGEDDLAD